MNLIFQDLQMDDNPRNGESFASSEELLDLLDELRRSRPPFMCELIGNNGFSLTIGIGGDTGCVQHAASDGTPPYLMAVDANTPELSAGEMEFVVGGTATPIDAKYSLPFAEVTKVIAEFATSGNRSDDVKWEEF